MKEYFTKKRLFLLAGIFAILFALFSLFWYNFKGASEGISKKESKQSSTLLDKPIISLDSIGKKEARKPDLSQMSSKLKDKKDSVYLLIFLLIIGAGSILYGLISDKKKQKNK